MIPAAEPNAQHGAPASDKEAGFSLVEIVIAVSIMMLVLPAMVGVFIAGWNAATSAMVTSKEGVRSALLRTHVSEDVADSVRSDLGVDPCARVGPIGASIPSLVTVERGGGKKVSYVIGNDVVSELNRTTVSLVRIECTSAEPTFSVVGRVQRGANRPVARCVGAESGPTCRTLAIDVPDPRGTMTVTASRRTS